MYTPTRKHRTAWLVTGATAVAVGTGVGAAYAVSGSTASAAPTVNSNPTGAARSINTSGFPQGGKNAGIFTDRCGYSHEAADDPILAPGRTGASMQHDFFGNTATNASSTAATLVGGTSTCSTSADASAYWAPVLYQNGTALTPSSALIYWRQKASSAHAVHTMPVGLQMIAGNETASSPQSTKVTAWTCNPKQSGPTSKATATPHDCAAGTNLRLTVQFPSCWDGTHLSGAGQTNVVYPDSRGSCPSSHPTLIPQVVFHVTYPTSSAAGISVSMTPTVRGSVDTEHVDFINGWTQATFNADEAACIATQTRCGPVTGTSATPRGPSKKALAQQRSKSGHGKARKHPKRHAQTPTT